MKSTTSWGGTDIPVYTPRVADLQERKLWDEQQKKIASPSNVATYWEEVEAQRCAQEKQWAENKRLEQAETAKANRDREAYNARVLRERAEAEQVKKNAIVADLMKDPLYVGWGATPEEIARIEKLVANNHRGDKSVDLRERLLLKMRNVMG